MSNDNEEKARRLSRREFVKGAGASAAVMAGVTTANTTPVRVDPGQLPESWDLEADVVVIGSGPTGLVAALRAREAGASVLIVEANYDSGGHGLINGGTVQLGGGTRLQKKFGIEDSADTMFQDPSGAWWFHTANFMFDAVFVTLLAMSEAVLRHGLGLTGEQRTPSHLALPAATSLYR